MLRKGLPLATRNHLRRRATALAVTLPLSMAALSSCARDCEKVSLTADPGRMVTIEGNRMLEVKARFTRDGQGVEGATLPFSFGFVPDDRPAFGVELGEVATDASGTAVFRRSEADLAFDARSNGRFDGKYTVDWESTREFDGKTYCNVSSTNTLPIDQLQVP